MLTLLICAKLVGVVLITDFRFLVFLDALRLSNKASLLVGPVMDSFLTRLTKYSLLVASARDSVISSPSPSFLQTLI